MSWCCWPHQQVAATDGPLLQQKCLKVIVFLFINNRDHVVRKVCRKIIVQQLINSDSFAIP